MTAHPVDRSSRTRIAWVVCLFCLTLAAVTAAPPQLSLTPSAPPQITVSGTAGARYELQYSPSLRASTNWVPWTILFMQDAVQTVADPAAPPKGQRFYRARVIDPGPTDYTPAQLTPMESYRLTSQSGAMSAIVETLVVLSETNGLLLRTGSPAEGSGSWPVQIQYRGLDNYNAKLEVRTAPMEPLIPTTNVYWLVYGSTENGFFKTTNAMGPVRVGDFQRDTSMIGQTAAPAQLTPGEIYRSTRTSAALPNVETLIVNSPTNGVLIEEYMGERRAVEVVLTYSRLQSYLATLQVVTPGSAGIPEPTTNTFRLTYTALNAGYIMSVTDSPEYPEPGEFVRDTSLVGQSLAPAQLVAGESYTLTRPSLWNVQTQKLLVNSVEAGILISEEPPMGTTFSEVALDWQPLGPLSARLEAVSFTEAGSPGPTTNTYWFVYHTATNGEVFAETYMQMAWSGPFQRDRSQVGQVLAPSALIPGESYQLTTVDAGMTNRVAVVVNSAQTGVFIQEGGAIGLTLKPPSTTCPLGRSVLAFKLSNHRDSILSRRRTLTCSSSSRPGPAISSARITLRREAPDSFSGTLRWWDSS